MTNQGDINRVKVTDKDWYRKIWTLDIKDMSWVEKTVSQVDFLWDVLQLKGTEKILDLACGLGRHSLELAKRGCTVVGIDLTEDYINEAIKISKLENVPIEFQCKDIRDVRYQDEFDVVLNMADGAIGYLEDDFENEKIFKVVSDALKPGGKHIMDICNGAYAQKYFPSRTWVAGSKSLSLADFDWDPEKSIMYYGGIDIKYSEVFEKPEVIYCDPVRLYNVNELSDVLSKYNMKILSAYGDYDKCKLASDDIFQIEICSIKE